MSVALVALVALVLRAAFLFRAPMFIIGDSENYFWPGYQLARGLGFDLDLRRTPLYPLFIAGVVSTIGEDLFALALAQHLLGVATAVLAALLARRLFGRWAGLAAGLLVALSGSQVLSEHNVMAEPLFTTLIAASALLGVVALQRTSLDRWQAVCLASSGMTLALAALARPIGLALLPVLPVLLLLQRPGLKRWFVTTVVFAVSVSAVLVPWSVRNALQHERLSIDGVPGQTLVGRTVRHDRFTFWDPTTMAPDPDPRRQKARELMQDAAERGSFITPLRRRITQSLGVTDQQANLLMRDLAVQAIIHQPAYFLHGTLLNFVALTGGWPERPREYWDTRRDAGSREEWEAYPSIKRLLGPPDPVQERQFGRAEQLVGFQLGRAGPLVSLLALVGILLPLILPSDGRRRWEALLPALWAATLVLVAVALVGPVQRYRFPAEPLLAALAVGGVAELIGLARRRMALARDPALSLPSSR
ncbi:MAG: glycosyltransferase family 39 protein [Chloroflexi bacterium]|nr:glycosyltransferase family 39 protein [Chloroflexota bacterium]